MPGPRPVFARLAIARLLAAVLWVSMLGLAPATAQPAGGTQATPILTINQERLFKDSLFGERIMREREEASRALAAENRKIEAQLTAEEKDLTRQRKTLPPEEFRKLADAFDEKVQGIRQAQDSKARALARQIENERQVFFGKVLPILNEIVRERGAVAILDRRAILVASDSIDVTDEALQLIDSRIGDGKTSQ